MSVVLAGVALAACCLAVNAATPVVAASTPAAVAISTEYRLGSGDVVRITSKTVTDELSINLGPTSFRMLWTQGCGKARMPLLDRDLLA